MGDRQVSALCKRFFNDGPFYILTSTSLGGSKLSAEDLTERLASGKRKTTEDLLRRGVCLPLFFNGDCVLDDAALVVGDLTEREEKEWIGRVRAKLEIPCGEFMLFGGFDDGLAEALERFEAPDPNFVYYAKHRVPPGTYLVEVYAFVGSSAIDATADESISGKEYLTDLIRLSRWRDEIPLPSVSEVANGFQWCATFETRTLNRRPAALRREGVAAPEPPAPPPPKPVFKARPRREGYACPLCGVAPLVGAFWKCDCGAVYDTFEVRGVCPKCHKQHETSACVGCKKSSSHFAFYPKTT